MQLSPHRVLAKFGSSDLKTARIVRVNVTLKYFCASVFSTLGNLHVRPPVVFREEVTFFFFFFFFLQNNELSLLSGGGNLSDMSSVLQVLDLHANNLDKLPEEIGTLKQLKVSVHIDLQLFLQPVCKQKCRGQDR